MTIRRAPLILCGAVVLALGACSSDGASTTTTTTVRSTVASTTTSTTAGGAGVGAGDGTGTTVAAGATTPSTVAGATTTTVKGARVVTNPADNLRIGDTGPGVKQVQEALVAKGFKVVVDSQYGLQTAKAVQDFQGKNGLTADGVCGPKTWAKLGGSAATATSAPTATTVAAATPSSAP